MSELAEIEAAFAAGMRDAQARMDELMADPSGAPLAADRPDQQPWVPPEPGDGGGVT